MENKNFTEKTLERIRSGKRVDSSTKSKKISRLILIADAAVIILIIFFLQNRKGDGFYKTVRFTKDKIAIRLSITKDSNSRDYLYSLIIKSNYKQKVTLNFKNEIATININSPKNLITSLHLGQNIKKLEILPNEFKNFITILNSEIIKEHILSHPDDVKKIQKTLIQLSNDYLEVENKIKINFIDEPQKSSIPFKCEVK